MKDRVVFLTMGILIATTFFIAGKSNSPVAQQNTEIFENVIIRGRLIIGNENNNITLENKDDSTNIIIDSKGCGIAFSTTDEEAILILSNDRITENIKGLPDGIALFTSKDKKIGKSNSLIRISDDNGSKIVRTVE